MYCFPDRQGEYSPFEVRPSIGQQKVGLPILVPTKLVCQSWFVCVAYAANWLPGRQKQVNLAAGALTCRTRATAGLCPTGP